jgi:hypothetical protein
MSHLARVHNGVVVLQSADDLPEGTLVQVTPLASLPSISNSAAVIAAMEAEPHLSPEDIDELNRAIAAGKRCPDE